MRFELAEMIRDVTAKLDSGVVLMLNEHYAETERDVGIDSPGLLQYGQHYVQHSNWVRYLAENSQICTLHDCFLLKVYALAYKAMAALCVDNRREANDRISALRTLAAYI